MKHTIIRVRIEESEILGLNDQVFDWEKYICGEVTDILPEDNPILLGNHITTVSYIDDNLFHNIFIRKYVTRILHLWNKTLID